MKRCILMTFMLFFILLTVLSQGVKWNKAYQDYFNKYKDVAIEQMRQYNIPASITLAQGVLESAAGKSELARKSNNHFGIKCHGWTGRKVYYDDDAKDECFRAYKSVYDSYVDHSLFLTKTPRYGSLFRLKITDYKGWAKGLKACGYATSPTYATKLIDIIECYRLYEYDRAKGRHHHPFGGGREVHEFNKNYYVIARAGDTFQSIADDMDMSRRTLARYNELDKDATLEEGDYVWLKKKRRNAPKEYKNRPHRVIAGESMYTISQKYGIRMKNLYKMNKLSPDYVIQVGDELRIR